VEPSLFSIACTTCRARLVVRDASAIGEIRECPKCSSFVHVLPPDGWEPPDGTAEKPAPQGDGRGAASRSAAGASTFAGCGASPAEASLDLVKPPDSPAETGLARAKPPPLPAGAAGSAPPAAGPTKWWVSPTELAWRRWLLWATIPPLGVVLGVAGWAMLGPGARPSPEPPPPETAVAQPEPVPPEAPEPPPVAPEPPIPAPQPAREAPDPAADSPSGPTQTDEPPKQGDPVQPEPELPGEMGEAAPPRSPGELSPGEARPVEPPAEQPPPDEAAPDEAPPAPRPAALPGLSDADVQTRLAVVVPAIEMSEMPLGEAFGLLGTLSTVPITLDADVLAPMELTLRDPITVRLSGATLGRAVAAAAEQVGLAPVVERGQVLVTAPAAFRREIRTMRYSVSDLTGSDPAALDELAAMIRRLVAPDRWEAAGGPGRLRVAGQTLEIDQTPAVHYEVIVFCEKLRVARGRLPRSRIDPERFTLATRSQRARAILDHPVTANFRHEAPLGQALGHLAVSAGADILIDRIALSAAGVTDQTPVSVAVEDEPLAAALDRLLHPLGLGYRVIDAETLQVTGRTLVDGRLEVEFHPVADRLARGGTVEGLIHEIKTGMGGAGWAESGGQAAILFDPPSGCLIVLQAQPVQRAVEGFLRKPPG
jgi:hypothetical protein